MNSIVLAMAIITLPQLAQAADWATITVAQAAMWPPNPPTPTAQPKVVSRRLDRENITFLTITEVPGIPRIDVGATFKPNGIINIQCTDQQGALDVAAFLRAGVANNRIDVTGKCTIN